MDSDAGIGRTRTFDGAHNATPLRVGASR